jgi:hypothetical protein
MRAKFTTDHDINAVLDAQPTAIDNATLEKSPGHFRGQCLIIRTGILEHFMTEGKKKSSLGMWIVVFVLMAGVGVLACAGAVVTLYYVLGPDRLGFGGAESPRALEKQFREALEENKTGGNTKAKEMLKLPESWFVENFGAARGKELHGKYSSRADDIERRFLIDLKTANQRKLEQIQVEQYDRKASFILKRTLDEMTGTPKLYQVFLHKTDSEKDGLTLGPFVYADGAFRFFCGDVTWNQVAKNEE